MGQYSRYLGEHKSHRQKTFYKACGYMKYIYHIYCIYVSQKSDLEG